MSIQSIADYIINQFRHVADIGRLYPAPEPWLVGDGNTHNKALAECIASTIENKSFERNSSWKQPINSIFNNLHDLPLNPVDGDRYIAYVTANTWTKDNIYQYDGTVWNEFVTTEGDAVYIKDENNVRIYVTSWIEFNSLLIIHNLNGPYHNGINNSENYFFMGDRNGLPTKSGFFFDEYETNERLMLKFKTPTNKILNVIMEDPDET